MTEAEKYEVVRQNWWEAERGEGSKAAGYSVHLSLSDLRAYVEHYWAGMPEQIPDWYEHPGLVLNPTEFYVNQAIYYKLLEEKKNGRFGLRVEQEGNIRPG